MLLENARCSSEYQVRQLSCRVIVGFSLHILVTRCSCVRAANRLICTIACLFVSVRAAFAHVLLLCFSST